MRVGDTVSSVVVPRVDSRGRGTHEWVTLIGILLLPIVMPGPPLASYL